MSPEGESKSLNITGILCTVVPTARDEILQHSADDWVSIK